MSPMTNVGELLKMAGPLSKTFSGNRPLDLAPDICPECASDLFYTEKGVIHLDPPRKRVKCAQCDYRGFLSVDSSPQGSEAQDRMN